MSKESWLQRVGFCCVVVAFFGTCHAADNPDPKAIKIALIGDSTVSSYAKPPADRPDLTGWGQVFGEFFTDRVTVLNHAASGRSSKSFRRENRWQPVLDLKPDYVFIQFGHNDQKKEGDRYADPETDFREQMKQYIAEARAAGATPSRGSARWARARARAGAAAETRGGCRSCPRGWR